MHRNKTEYVCTDNEKEIHQSISNSVTVGDPVVFFSFLCFTHFL